MAARSELLSACWVMDVLSDFPTPEWVMDLKTREDDEIRLEALAAKNEANTLSFREAIELEHYRVAEHMVWMTKAKAFIRLLKA